MVWFVIVTNYLRTKPVSAVRQTVVEVKIQGLICKFIASTDRKYRSSIIHCPYTGFLSNVTELKITGVARMIEIPHLFRLVDFICYDTPCIVPWHHNLPSGPAHAPLLYAGWEHGDPNTPYIVCVELRDYFPSFSDLAPGMPIAQVFPHECGVRVCISPKICRVGDAVGCPKRHAKKYEMWDDGLSPDIKSVWIFSE